MTLQLLLPRLGMVIAQGMGYKQRRLTIDTQKNYQPGENLDKPLSLTFL